MTTRQATRRELFQSALARMPLWEVWTYDRAVKGRPGETVTHGNYRLIPRRKRREMARIKSRRDWYRGQ